MNTVPPPPAQNSRTADSLTLRGGRLRKTSRGLLTFAPFLATTSAVALGALLTLGGNALAGMCEEGTMMSPGAETTEGTGIFTCTGTADNTSDTTQTISSMATSITVGDGTTAWGISVPTGSSNSFALDIDGTGAQNVTVNLDHATTISSAADSAIDLTHNGTGTVTVTLAGDISTGSSGTDTINISHTGTSGNVTLILQSGASVDNNKTVASSDGINVSTYRAGQTDMQRSSATMTITTTGATVGGTASDSIGGTGIAGWQTNNGLLTISSGPVFADSDGINAIAAGTGGISITTAGDVRGNIQSTNGIGSGSGPSSFNSGIKASASASSTGNIDITVASGNTISGNRGINAFVADGNTTTNITLDINGGTVESAGMGTENTSIFMSGGNSHTLLLRNGAMISNNIVTDDTDATLEVAISATVNGTIDTDFTIDLDSTTTPTTMDSLTVMDFVKGGTLTLNVNFMDSSADTLIIGGDVTGTDGETTTINLVTSGGTLADLSDPIDLVTFTTAANSDLSEFTAGMVDDSGTFTLARDSATGALQIALAPAGPVTSGCVEQSTMGTFICSGTLAETQSLTAPAEEGLNVTDRPGFTITSAMGNAFTFTNDTASTSMTIDLDGDITTTGSGGYAIHATHTGTGAASITTGGTVMTSNSTAIRALTSGTATSLTITNSGSITAGGSGAIGVSAALSAADGNLEITNSGSITAGATAISALHDGDGGDLNITTTGSISGTTGISANISDPNDMNDMGAISVTVSDSVTGTAATDPTAIRMQGGASQTLILHSGADITGDVIANYDDTAMAAAAAADRVTATLELGGATDASFNLADLADFTGFTDFAKTGTGTWTLTGTQPTGSAFTEASVTEGTLRLDGTENAVTFRPGSSTLTIGSDTATDPAAILEILGNATIAGALDINQTGTAASTLDIDFTTDPASPTAEQLEITGSVTGSVTLNLNVAADADVAYMDDPASSDRLLLVDAAMSTTANAAAITPNPAGCAIQSGRRGTCTFTLLPVAGTGWYLDTLTLEFLASDPTYEGYATTLTNLAALSSASTRLANRIYDPRNNIWGQIQGEQTTLKPNATSPGAEYDTQHSRVRFGFDMPAPPLKGVFETAPILGFNAWLGQSETDITATDAEPGEVETDAFAAATTVTLQQGVFHFDGQLQYTSFSSDISVAGETRASNRGGDAISAAAEIGMRLPQMHGITLTPQIQLSWISIDFDAFTDSEDTRIGLADGETAAARFGITATAPLTAEGLSLFSPRPIQGTRGEAGDGAGTFLHASADLHLPLDGKTSARIGDNSAISDLEEESLSLGIGMSHSWNATTLSADFATTQGEDTETYRATLSATLAF